MKKTPERIEALAAEYVLGSLRGAARRRFEEWMMESAWVRREVWFWEEKLGGLAEDVPENQPPASVWRNIERRLWGAEERAGQREPRGIGRWFWPSWSVLATAGVLVLAVLFVQQPRPTGDQLSGAIIQADLEDPLWLVSESGAENLLKLRSIAASEAEPGKDYELWVVPENGEPLSLGVIPAGGVHQVRLNDEARKALSQSRTLAISLELRGGSPTGAPTGPILHVTKLYSL
ncbi:MAG: anti-sigma factor [Marinobacter sp.]|uniref:anti-sigma factor n=1 Tax=Marinobacter sp. TaxID=50741 RepID=UPI00396D0F9D